RIQRRAQARRARKRLLEIDAGLHWPAPMFRRSKCHPTRFAYVRLARSCFHSLLSGRLPYGGTNARIGAAAANVARHRLVDVGIGGLRFLLEQRGRGHDLARLAIAALGYAQFDPRGLHRLALLTVSDRLD